MNMEVPKKRASVDFEWHLDRISMNFKGGFWNVQTVQNGVQVVSEFLDDIPIISPSYPHCIPVLVSYNPHVGVMPISAMAAVVKNGETLISPVKIPSMDG